MKIIFNKKEYPFSTQKIVCVGRNYADHAKELSNPIPSEPLLFIKPPSALCALSGRVTLPKVLGAVHLETELAVLISEHLPESASLEACEQAVIGIGLSLDLTLRDLQTSLKKQGHPWERAKAFAGSCPVSEFVERKPNQPWSSLAFDLHLNGKLQQRGKISDTLFTIPELVQASANAFTLSPGDIVLTGTPKGVCELAAGDELAANLVLVSGGNSSQVDLLSAKACIG